jgi:hypothetical protein
MSTTPPDSNLGAPLNADRPDAQTSQGAGRAARIYVLKPFTPSQNSPTMDPGPGRSGAPAPPASALIHQKSNSGVEIENSGHENEAKAAPETEQKAMPGRLRKKSFSIEDRIRWMRDKYGYEHLGFQTLTVRENLTDGRELNRRFKSLTRNVFPKLYDDWLRVYERQKRGAWHVHIVVALKADIRTGTNVGALNQLLQDKKGGKISKGAYYRGLITHASPTLRAIWKAFRRLCGLGEFKHRRESKGQRYYKFDASHLLPVLSTPEALAAYVSQYIGKGFENRRPNDKGMRLVGCSRRVNAACSERFTWAKGAGSLFRRKLGMLAGLVGFRSMDDFARRLGPKWAYHIKPVIGVLTLPYYPCMKMAYADGWDLVNVADGSPWPWPDLTVPKDHVQESQIRAFAAFTDLLARKSGRKRENRNQEKPHKMGRTISAKMPKELQQVEFEGLESRRVWAD